MATAPTPGQRRRSAESDVKKVVKLRIRDDTYYVPLALTIQEKIVLRNQTGLPFEAFFKSGQNTFGEDSLVVMWWLGRRAAGESTLSFEKACDQWPLLELRDEDDLDLDLVDITPQDEVDHPEPSGPSS